MKVKLTEKTETEAAGTFELSESWFGYDICDHIADTLADEHGITVDAESIQGIEDDQRSGTFRARITGTCARADCSRVYTQHREYINKYRDTL